MKYISSFLDKVFSSGKSNSSVSTDEVSFFDYSARKKKKLITAAGREAQKEQQQVLKAYQARFGA